MLFRSAVLRGLLITLFAVLATPAAARFGESPDVWLEQMEKALASVDYRGTFVYIHDDQAETMLVYHRVDQNGTQERLVSLNGSAREVLRNDDEVKCILPDDKAVFVEKRHRPGTLAKGVPLNALQSSDHYEFKLLGVGRIAGYSSRLVAIEPRDSFRYGYKLWLEENTALPLRSELINEAGQPVEKMMFTEIDIGADIDDTLLQASVTGDGFTWHVRGTDKDTMSDQDSPVQFESLPPGFRVTSTEIREQSGEPSYHLVLSDGLASVSVFAEPLQDGKPSLAGLSRLGAVNAYGVRLQNHHVTIVGEVPEATVAAVGKAVRFFDQ